MRRARDTSMMTSYCPDNLRCVEIFIVNAANRSRLSSAQRVFICFLDNVRLEYDLPLVIQ